MLKLGQWVCTEKGIGKRVGFPEKVRHFKPSSVGVIEGIDEKSREAIVYLVGINERWIIPISELKVINVKKTGDKHRTKICNTCLRLLPTTKFAKNQTNLHGSVRRPACDQCRTDIDKRAPKSRQAKMMNKIKPAEGSLFQCPICQRRSIVGVTAKIVADHNHHTGNIRDFICDSCNTGLGRFKNGEDYLKNAIRYLQERDGES